MQLVSGLYPLPEAEAREDLGPPPPDGALRCGSRSQHADASGRLRKDTGQVSLRSKRSRRRSARAARAGQTRVRWAQAASRCPSSAARRRGDPSPASWRARQQAFATAPTRKNIRQHIQRRAQRYAPDMSLPGDQVTAPPQQRRPHPAGEYAYVPAQDSFDGEPFDLAPAGNVPSARRGQPRRGQTRLASQGNVPQLSTAKVPRPRQGQARQPGTGPAPRPRDKHRAARPAPPDSGPAGAAARPEPAARPDGHGAIRPVVTRRSPATRSPVPAAGVFRLERACGRRRRARRNTCRSRHPPGQAPATRPPPRAWDVAADSR